jgi:hypothetical protein
MACFLQTKQQWCKVFKTPVSVAYALACKERNLAEAGYTEFQKIM